MGTDLIIFTGCRFMEADLNARMQSVIRKGRGLSGLNDWLSLAYVIFTNLPEDFD